MKKLWYLAALSTALSAISLAPPAFGQGAAALKIEVLSSRPALVTGGDALVKIIGTSAAPTVTVGGANVSGAFKPHPAGGWVGLVTGLKDGENALVAKAGANEASVTLVNHPINGTLFAGPQQKPFVCENEAHGLAPATDESCSAPTKVDYFYRSKTDKKWMPFQANSPRPADLDETTTSLGQKVPLIVRRELGVINRAPPTSSRFCTTRPTRCRRRRRTPRDGMAG